MRLVDARRLRGPSLGATGPGAIVEIALEPGEGAAEAAALVLRCIRALEWAGTRLRRAPASPVLSTTIRRFAGGLACSVRTRIDELDFAVELLEEAVALARGRTTAVAARARLRRIHAKGENPALVELARAAEERGVPFLFDDERVTLGHARRSRTVPIDAIPRSIPWRAIGRIPVALVTGTNGKTTTTRWVARMAKHAGLVPGNTSSDGTAIDEVLVEPGDNTGGESARAVLRDPRVEIAILETARGGLLRRGLAVSNVDAALITNVTADHLGEHGVLDLATLVDTKAVVGHAVRPGGKVVLGADDPRLVHIAKRFAAEHVWFAASPKSARAPIARGETTFTVEKGAIVRVRGRARKILAKLADVPLTSGGRAAHNVKNALAASALAWSLGLPDRALIAGLRSFGRTPADNPGRGDVVDAPGGVRVVLDFGHNPAAASELYAWARALAGRRGAVHAVLTQPGDRDDRAMRAFARAVVASGIASAHVWETEHLHRGRASGEISARLVKELRAAGATAVFRAEDEAAAIRGALSRAKKGDLVVVSPSLDRAIPR